MVTKKTCDVGRNWFTDGATSLTAPTSPVCQENMYQLAAFSIFN